MQSILRGAAAGLIGLFLTGCLGIGHVSVSAPPLAITARSANPFDVDVLCPNFYGEPWTFVALATDSLEPDARHYDWKRIQFSPLTSTRAACRDESRYIGFPVVLFLPTWPSSKAAKSRRLFVHVEKENVVYRIALIGDSARVESIRLEVAQRDFPHELSAPEPPVSAPAWQERIRVRGEYYRSLKWQRSDRIAITDAEIDADGAILSVSMSIR